MRRRRARGGRPLLGSAAASRRLLATAILVAVLASSTGTVAAARSDPVAAARSGPVAAARSGPVAAARTGPAPAVRTNIYLAPVRGELWRGFEPPATAHGPGHRGVDLAARPGDPVGAAAPGVVAHAGPVAGTTWVSIDHPDGIRTAYGPLTAPVVRAGQRVRAGEVLGRLAAGGHGHQRRDRGLHLSARRDGAYLDPRTLLGDTRRPSLVGPGAASVLSRPGHRPARAPVTGPAPRRGPVVTSVAGRAARPGPPRAVGQRWTP